MKVMPASGDWPSPHLSCLRRLLGLFGLEPREAAEFDSIVLVHLEDGTAFIQVGGGGGHTVWWGRG